MGYGTNGRLCRPLAARSQRTRHAHSPAVVEWAPNRHSTHLPGGQYRTNDSPLTACPANPPSVHSHRSRLLGLCTIRAHVEEGDSVVPMVLAGQFAGPNLYFGITNW